MRDPELSIAGWMLLERASTYRQRAFARLVSAIHHDSIEFAGLRERGFQVYPLDPSPAGLMMACAANTWCREALSLIPISRSPRSEGGDPELVPMLQDIADALAAAASEAFTTDYFPGLPDITVPEDHVAAVMQALQREMDREGHSRQRDPVHFAELPPERQRALAERRRWWFARFGITPDSWQSGYWSVWDVTDDRYVPVAAKQDFWRSFELAS